MLDKSIPYKHILMKRPKGSPVKDYVLPNGYSFCNYKDGHELYWAEIESSVDEFDDRLSALKYFTNEYLPYVNELKQRQIYVQDPAGYFVGTLTAWWNFTGDRRDAAVHWVAIKPEFQGKGLGKALVAEGLRRTISIDGDVDVYLHTQTWSYKAINIYLELGFEFLRGETFGGYRNEYVDAIKIIGNRIKTV